MYVLRESILHKLNNVLYWHEADIFQFWTSQVPSRVNLKFQIISDRYHLSESPPF